MKRKTAKVRRKCVRALICLNALFLLAICMSPDASAWYDKISIPYESWNSPELGIIHPILEIALSTNLKGKLSTIKPSLLKNLNNPYLPRNLRTNHVFKFKDFESNLTTEIAEKSKNLRSGQIAKLLGPPTIVTGPNEKAEESLKVQHWTYFLGFNRIKLDLTFRKGRCTSTNVDTKTLFDSFEEAQRKAKAITSFCPGKTRVEITEKFGKPFTNNPVLLGREWKAKPNTLILPTYLNTIVILHFKNGKCISSEIETIIS